MSVVGLIAEYNPFHFGHASQLAYLRKQVPGATFVVAMSPYFSQRGEAAVLDPWTRARVAVRAGADLVLALPQIFAMSEADLFAQGAVQTLAACGLVDYLAFGSEAGQIAAFEPLVALLGRLEKEESLQERCLAWQREGDGYASAFAKLATQELGPPAAALLEGPNNILAMHYLFASSKLPSEVRPRALTHPRFGVGEQEQASTLRLRLQDMSCSEWDAAQASSAWSQLLQHIPPHSAAALLNSPIRPGALGGLAFADLRRLPLSELESISGLQDGLAGRLAKAARHLEPDTPEASLWAKLVEAGTTRHLSRARVGRSLAALCLRLTTDLRAKQEEAGVQYLRVLAYSKRGQKLLASMRKTARLPLILRSSDFFHHNARGQAFFDQFNFDLRAADLWHLAVRGKSGREFQQIPFRDSSKKPVDIPLPLAFTQIWDPAIKA